MRAVNEIIVHCAATPEGKDFSAKDIDRWHKERGWSGIGYHYVIRLNGDIEKGRPVERIGAHVAGRNKNTIGVCYIGGVSANDPRKARDTRTQAQKESLKRLLKQLLRKYPKITQISGHRDYAAKACPSFDATSEYAYLVADRVDAKSLSGTTLRMGDGRRNGRQWEVKALQRKLKDLGYHSGLIDGQFGRMTRDAVQSLQADYEITVDGVVGPDTHAALASATKVDFGTRSVASVRDVISDGSRIMKSSSIGKWVASLGGGGVAAAAGAKEGGFTQANVALLDQGENAVATGERVFSLVNSGKDLLGLIASHWWVVLAALMLAILYYLFKISSARLQDHREGKTV